MVEDEMKPIRAILTHNFRIQFLLLIFFSVEFVEVVSFFGSVTEVLWNFNVNIGLARNSISKWQSASISTAQISTLTLK